MGSALLAKLRDGTDLVAGGGEHGQSHRVEDAAAGIAYSARERHLAQAAESLAALIVSSVRGAIVMARARGDMAPLDRVGRELERLVRDATETT